MSVFEMESAITQMASEIQDLKEKLSIAEANEEEEATLSSKLLEENKQLKGDLLYTTSEVSRYSNALELEYVQKWEFDELKEENEKLKKEKAEVKEIAYESGYDACCEEESVDKEYLEELEGEIKELKKLVDEYKKCSLREADATPQEITDYMKEMSIELEAVQKDYEELSMWEDEIYDTLDMSDLCSSRDDVVECITDHYNFYDITHMDELRGAFSQLLNDIKDEYWQIYADQGLDPEAPLHELKDGEVHTSLKKMQYIFETTWSSY